MKLILILEIDIHRLLIFHTSFENETQKLFGLELQCISNISFKSRSISNNYDGK